MSELYLTTNELAKILNVTHVTIFRWIKSKKIKAHRVGRNYRIATKDVKGLIRGELSKEQKAFIDKAVKKAIHDYGVALRLLGKK